MSEQGWELPYGEVLCSVEEAISRIRSGQRVFVGSGCALPQALCQALIARAEDLADLEITQLLTLENSPFLQQPNRELRLHSFCQASVVRPLIAPGLSEYTPVLLSEIPRLFKSGKLPLDVALIQVAPPDERGLCSLGISVDIVKSAAENAGLVIAQVNPCMPRTKGNSSISVYDIDILVAVEEPLMEVSAVPPNDVVQLIGKLVAGLVDDGSTLQFGFGSISQAMPLFLKDKRDLGIHTGLFSDSLLALIEAGAVSGACKSQDQGKIVTSMCLGSRSLYDFVRDNPRFAFLPVDYVTDPAIISRSRRMVVINSALEVDLTGQVCVDSLGSEFFTGLGGGIDFMRGAQRAPDGKVIVVLPSTAKGDQLSRIVTRLTPGSGVGGSRADAHYVVTEYGVAYLHGKSIQERALSLISIAHPEFRSALIQDAVDAKYVRPGRVSSGGQLNLVPHDLQSALVLEDGTLFLFRPIHATDESQLCSLFYGLSPESVYLRWMGHLKQSPRKQMTELMFLDQRAQVAMVGTLTESHGEEIIAMGGYDLDPKTNRAEIYFTVRDEWQSHGLGTYLFKLLVQIAIRNGISGFTAEVLMHNKRMLSVIQKSGYMVQTRMEEGVLHCMLDFPETI